MNVLGISITRAQGPTSKAAPLALLTVAGLVAATGTAYAVWSTTGTGTGQARATTFQAVTVTAGTASAQLYPGGTGDLVVVATNPNPFPVTVTISSIGTVAGCTTPAVTLVGTPSFTLTANQSAASKSMIGALSMGTTSSNDCQGVSLSIPLNTSSVSS